MCLRVQQLDSIATRVARALGVVGVVWVIALSAAPVAQADPVAVCTSDSVAAGCSSWFRSDVTVSWSAPDTTVSGCPDQVVTAPPAGETSTTQAVACTADDGTTSPGPVIQIDRASPGVAAPPPNANDWYTAPVTLAGSDVGSGLASCTPATYSGPDSRSASVPWSCTDLAGNVASGTFALQYDATPPVVTLTPARPPDTNGWYRGPVGYTVTGSDGSGSGAGPCPSVTYAGPDSATASVTGTCVDQAGNVGIQTLSLMYDATPPAISGLTAVGGDKSVAVVWSTDAASAEVLRVPGVGEPASIVFAGSSNGFVDRQVHNGTTYTYRVTVRDLAGNASTQSLVVVPGAPDAAPGAGESPVTVLETIPPTVVPKRPRIRPAPRSVLFAGQAPLLRWPASKRARYYNVQLYRNGRKILSVWPSRPRYHLKLRWTYKDTQRRLRPARYRWMVWPGLGTRARATYGKRIVNSTFVVRRFPSPIGTR
jgi:hypothetical protein